MGQSRNQGFWIGMILGLGWGTITGMFEIEQCHPYWGDMCGLIFAYFNLPGTLLMMNLGLPLRQDTASFIVAALFASLCNGMILGAAIHSSIALARKWKNKT